LRTAPDTTPGDLVDRSSTRPPVRFRSIFPVWTRSDSSWSPGWCPATARSCSSFSRALAHPAPKSAPIITRK